MEYNFILAYFVLLVIASFYFMSVSAIAVDAARRSGNKALLASSGTCLAFSLLLIVVLIGLIVKPEYYNSFTGYLILISLGVIFSCSIHASVVAQRFTDQDIARDARQRLFDNSIAVSALTGLFILFRRNC